MVDTFNKYKDSSARAILLEYPSSMTELSVTMHQTYWSYWSSESLYKESLAVACVFKQKNCRKPRQSNTLDTYSKVGNLRYMYIDYKTLVYAFRKNSLLSFPSQTHLEFIRQFSTNWTIRHLVGKENVIADTLFQVKAIQQQLTSRN